MPSSILGAKQRTCLQSVIDLGPFPAQHTGILGTADLARSSQAWPAWPLVRGGRDHPGHCGGLGGSSRRLAVPVSRAVRETGKIRAGGPAGRPRIKLSPRATGAGARRGGVGALAAGGDQRGGGDAARRRLRRRACSPSCARPLPALWGRREAQLSILSSPREALGHVPRPDKDRVGARSAARNLAISAPRAAAPARPGPATPDRYRRGERQGCAAARAVTLGPARWGGRGSPGPRGSPPSPTPGLPSRRFFPRDPRFPPTGAPSAQPGALASPLLARRRCLLKVTRRRGGVRGAPALAAAHPSARRAAPGRPGCRLLPPQSPLLNQRGEASPPPPAARTPRAAIGRAGAPRPGPPRSSRRAIGCGSPPAFT